MPPEISKVQLPPKIKAFINDVISTPLESINVALKGFAWDFDKGDFHHWVDLFNHFDVYFEKFVKPRRDLNLECNFLEPGSPFPKDTVLQILRVVRIVLENCSNKHFYSSYEVCDDHHLSYLLVSTDGDVVEATLQTFASFLKKSSKKCSIRDKNLISKLFALAQGWGSKEEGLGLASCCIENDSNLLARHLGSTLHFEFYDVGDPLNEFGNNRPADAGLRVIHFCGISTSSVSDLELLERLVTEYKVPPSLRFALLTRLRFARAFASLALRHQYTCIRLYAFTILVQASYDGNELASFFNNDPEFINELVSVLGHGDSIPEKIRILAIHSLVAVALCQDRSRLQGIVVDLTSGCHRGMLPALMQKAVNSVTNDNSMSVFAEALLSLITVIVSSSSACIALREPGFIPTLLPLLKDLNPSHLHLVSVAVQILEAFMDYSNPAARLFRDLGGLDDTIARLRIEVSEVEKGPRKSEDNEIRGKRDKGKTIVNSSDDLDTVPLYSDSVVSHNRKLLLKALLRTIYHGAYAPAVSIAHICGSENSVLLLCLRIIFSRSKDFGGGVFSLAATVMRELIHKDPTCFPLMDAAGLPGAFLDAITGGVLCSADAISCIPQCLDALCLNAKGLQAVIDCNALKCFVNFFTSRAYLRALSGKALQTLSTGLYELMRHTSALRGPGVDMLIEVLHSIAKIGSGHEPILVSSGSLDSSVPMETDVDERASRTLDAGETSIIQTSENTAEATTDNSVSKVESFLVEYLNNAARLLEPVLQNSDTCRTFMEKKGIEAILQLFTLPLLPLPALSAPNMSPAFKNFPPQHSASLARSVCTFLNDHLRMTNETLGSVGGTRYVDLEGATRTKVLRCLSCLEYLLTFTVFLLKGTTTMLPELGSSDADILMHLGKVYKEILWQISSMAPESDQKLDSHEKVAQVETVKSSNGGRECHDDVVSAMGHVSPASAWTSSATRLGHESEFYTVMNQGDGISSRYARRHHGIEGSGRSRGGRTSRHADISSIDAETSLNASELAREQELKRMSPDALAYQILIKLAGTIRLLFSTLIKGFTAPSRRRTDTGVPNNAAKSLAAALAKIFHEALSFSGRNAASEMSMLVKCRFLGTVVVDIASLIFDSKRSSSHAALINNFYVHGTFKELLTTFEATAQLLWTLSAVMPTSPCTATVDTLPEGSSDCKISSHNSCVLDTLKNYCVLFEYFVNSSYLLSGPSASQLLVQPVDIGLSISLFAVPRDPDVFVRMLQSQVLDVIFPVWKHPLFGNCNPDFICSVVKVVNLVYSGIGNMKNVPKVVNGSSQRLLYPALDESRIATIMEMGFSRSRAEEALGHVHTNSVEMAMEWLFNHPEELPQDDDELARALALSLGTAPDAPKEGGSDRKQDVPTEEKDYELPPIDDILSASMKLLQNGGSVVFPLTDLLVTLCGRNKCGDRPRVVMFLIQNLKLCPVEISRAPLLSAMSHMLALLLKKDNNARAVAADNGIIPAVLDILDNLKLSYKSAEASSISKFLTMLLLILDILLQPKPTIPSENLEGITEGPSLKASSNDIFSPPAFVDESDPSHLKEKEAADVFEKILGKATGYLTLEESQQLLVLVCNFIRLHVPAIVMQALLQLCARLTKTHVLATQFLEHDGLCALLSLPKSSTFTGYEALASSIIRHLIEDPQTLQTSMELEIRQSMTSISSRHGGHVSTMAFLTSLAPVISRDPAIFMRAAASICQLESSRSNLRIVLRKDKEKDKEKDRSKATDTEVGSGPSSNECTRASEPNGKVHDVSGKCLKGHKKFPQSLAQVIDHLLEIIMNYPSPENHEDHLHMEMDAPSSKEKGKTKVDDIKLGFDSTSERSAALAKVTFVLKLLGDILLTYVHAVAYVIRRDLEISQLHGIFQVSGSRYGGVGLLHHILNDLVPPNKASRNSEDERKKLSDNACCFLVILCGRSNEGRKRVLGELVKALSASSNMGSSSKAILLPSSRLLAFADLANSILSKNPYSSILSSPGYSPDIAKTMIDGGMIQALTGGLQVIDLDNPEAPKVVNLLIKTLETLTRAANANEQICKSDGSNKKRLTEPVEKADDQVTAPSSGDAGNTTEDAVRQSEVSVDVMTEAAEQPDLASHNEANPDPGQGQPIEPEMRMEVEVTLNGHPSMEHAEGYNGNDLEHHTVLHDGDGVEMTFHVQHGSVHGMGDEDDEDMGDDGEDDDDDGDEDEDEDEDEADDVDEDLAQNGAGAMSLVDTDVEDHDENGLGDEYFDDMLDEEDGDDHFRENHVIEVRWRQELDRLGDLQVLRREVGSSPSIYDLAPEPFHGLSVDNIFGIRGSGTVDRRRQTGTRSSLEHGNPFQHPLLLRSSSSMETSGAAWPSAVTRDLDPIPLPSVDATNFYMFDNALLPHVDAFGDRRVDFFSGMDSAHIARRGLSYGRWTDDAQPQTGGQSTAIAQAIETTFVSYLRSLSPMESSSTVKASEENKTAVQPSNVEGQSLGHGGSSGEQRAFELSTQAIHIGDHMDSMLSDLSVPHQDNESRDADVLSRELPDNFGGHDVNIIRSDISDLITGEMTQIMQQNGDADSSLHVSTTVPGIANPPSQVGTTSERGLDAGLHLEGNNCPPAVDFQSADHVLLDSDLETSESVRGQIVSSQISADVEMDGVGTTDDQVEGPVSSSHVEIPMTENVVPDDNQVEPVHMSNSNSTTNAIDPTFLEALPDDLRAEVLASTQAQSVPAATYTPPSAEDIDPEFLAALPPEIQEEVLAQQRALLSQPVVGQPVDMDNASIIATLPPDLREEVLLTSSDAVLSALPPPLVAEAQILRDRMRHYQAHSIFGMHRFGGRGNPVTIERLPTVDRGVGVTMGRRTASATVNSLKIKEVEGAFLLDISALRALIRLLRLVEPLGKGVLQRLFLNLCANSATRSALIRLLVNMISLAVSEVPITSTSGGISNNRLYGCQWNVVYGRSQLTDGMPPLVSRRVVEMLTFLATNYKTVADFLLFFPPSSDPEFMPSERHTGKGKAKVFDGAISGCLLEASKEGDVPFILFLKLLDQPLLLCSNSHLEQVMSLLQVVVNNAILNINSQFTIPASDSSRQALTGDTPPCNVQSTSSAAESLADTNSDRRASAEASTSGRQLDVSPYDVLLGLPGIELKNLCKLLSLQGLSEKVYTHASEIVKKLASVVPAHRKFFMSELANIAHELSRSGADELSMLESNQALDYTLGSTAGAAILRVLQGLSALISLSPGGNNDGEWEDQGMISELYLALQQLWQQLSICISKTEANLAQAFSFPSLRGHSNAADNIAGSSTPSPPLPPATQRLLPFIESLFVLSEKLQLNQPILQQDMNNITAGEVKESSGSSSPDSASKYGVSQKPLESALNFGRFAEKHRRLLNAFIRQDPSLLEKSLSLMLKIPRLIDFDNKRANFRSRIRQQHEQHPSSSLRISIRRAYILEDSYNQLRMKPSHDMRRRLAVQFQGEEGIDAGGLTREWFLLLSRVVFDKGALLFTTVGNNASFQPNPNSVYQTEHLSYFKFVGRVVAKALLDGQLLDVHFTRSFYKHMLGAKVTYHDIEAIDPDYYKNLKWMLENDVSDIPDLTFSIDADEEKHILYEKGQVTDVELIPGGRNIRVTEETKHEYVDRVAEHRLTTAIRPQINSFLEGFNELVPRELISIFNDKELELLISGLPEIDIDDLQANTEYSGYTGASSVIQWFWEVVKAFSKEDMARLLQFVTGTSKVPLEGFKALQGISGAQRFQIHRAYGPPERLPSAHTCFNQIDLPEYSSKEQLEERLLLAIHEGSQGFGFA